MRLRAGVGMDIPIDPNEDFIAPLKKGNGFILSAKSYKAMKMEQRNLVRAKGRALIGTAVFGTAFAIMMGVLIRKKN